MAEHVAYKVMTASDVAALDGGIFDGAPIDIADGYIHLSTAAQLAQTVARHFAGHSNLTIVAVDLRALGDAVRWEPSRGGELFPHVYSHLTRAVVIGRCALALEVDGTVRLPFLRTAHPSTEIR